MFPTSVCTRLFTPQPCVRCHALLTQLAAILANPNTAVGFSGIGNMTSSVDVMPPPPLPQSALGSARAPRGHLVLPISGGGPGGAVAARVDLLPSSRYSYGSGGLSVHYGPEGAALRRSQNKRRMREEDQEAEDEELRGGGTEVTEGEDLLGTPLRRDVSSEAVEVTN
jgi:hypothetical protein